ncbi:MAG: TolC family protein, partial [Methylococcales bacterium]|nr:TolC family protein [Methylococcales bacterium]
LADSDSKEKEKVINEIIKQGLIERSKNNLIFQNDKIYEISPREAALKSLNYNIAIQKSRLSKKVAKSIYIEAEALFDPVITVSFLGNHSKKYDRVENFLKFKGETVVVAQNNQLGAVDPETRVPNCDKTECFRRNISSGVLAYVEFDKFRPEGFESRSETGSIRDIFGSTKKTKLTFDWNQKVSWGGEVGLNLSTTYQKNFFIINGDAAQAGIVDGVDTAIFGAYDKPWVSTLVARIITSLPFAKDFGRYSPDNVSVRTSKLNKDKTYRQVEKSINQSLLQVEQRFWQLVKSAQNLYVSVKNRKNIEALAQKTQRLFEKRMATGSTKAEIDAQLARLKGQEENEWDNLVRASNSLKRELDQEYKGQILLPVDYAYILFEQDGLIEAKSNEANITYNPELKEIELNKKIAEINVEASKVAARPDLSYILASTFSQSNSVYGYAHLDRSLANIVEPDSVSIFTRLSYRYPWGNHAANANITVSEAALENQKILYQVSKNKIQTSYNNANMAVESAKSRVKVTKRLYELTQLTYKKSIKQMDLGKITEYELLVKNNDMINAQKTWIQSLIDKKQAEARLLAAKGILARIYALRTAQTVFDRHRINSLAQNAGLKYFRF